MTEWRNKVETTMDSIVNDISTVQAALIAQKPLILIVNVFENGTEAVRIIDSITEAGRVNNRQTKLHSALFNLNSRCIKLQCLFLLFC